VAQHIASLYTKSPSTWLVLIFQRDPLEDEHDWAWRSVTASHLACSIRKEESKSAPMQLAHRVHDFLVKLRAVDSCISGVSTRHRLIRVTFVWPPAKIVTFEHDFSFWLFHSVAHPVYCLPVRRFYCRYISIWSLRLPDLNVSGEVHGRGEFLHDRTFWSARFPSNR